MPIPAISIAAAWLDTSDEINIPTVRERNINKNDTAISSVKLPLIDISSKNTAKNIIVKRFIVDIIKYGTILEIII